MINGLVQVSKKSTEYPFHYNTQLKLSPIINRNLTCMLLIVIYMAYSVENVWITALMIIYRTANIVDAFIWILPNIIAILIRPYVIKYVNMVAITLNRQIRIISTSMFAAGLGCFIIGYSTLIHKKSYIIRIFLCTIGWIVMDVGMQLAQFFTQKVNQFLDTKFLVKTKISDKKLAVIGSLIGYGFSFILFYLSGITKVKNFYANCKIIYYIIGIVSIGASLLLKTYFELPLETSLLQKFQIKQFIKHPQYYLPGYLELKSSSLKTKLMLTIHFCIEFLVDSIQIYVTMWIVLNAQNLGYKQGGAYCLGMKNGSIGLIIFTILAQYKIFSLKKANDFIYMCLGIAVLGIITFYSFSIVWLFLFIIGISLTVNNYRNKWQEQWNQKNRCFLTCKQFIIRIEKIFILCPMPFIVMIILRRDDIEDVILWCSISLICISLCFYKLNMINKRQDIKKEQ